MFVCDRAGAACGNHWLMGPRFLRHATGIQDHERHHHSSSESGTEESVVHFPIPLLIEHSARKIDLSRSIKFKRPGGHFVTGAPHRGALSIFTIPCSSECAIRATSVVRYRSAERCVC